MSHSTNTRWQKTRAKRGERPVAVKSPLAIPPIKLFDVWK
jgi:hypothetical protein